MKLPLTELPSIIASCNCLTKTNEPEYHDLKCPFRLLSQIELLKAGLRRVRLMASRPSCGPRRDIVGTCESLLNTKEHP
jgi:hypothetical protein